MDLGRDDAGGAERVVPHDVEGDELGPFLVADDAGFAGVAGGGDLGPVGVEVIGADPGAADDPGAFADFGGADPADGREPSGASVQPGLVADPLEPVPGDHAPGVPEQVPA